MHYDPEKVTYFAETDARGKRVKFGIKAKDRERHMYVIGKTGMGKSTMLENLAIQDIQNGEGLAFIDPHGSTADKLLDYVPEHRLKDVLYFAPFDMDNPVSFNVMEDVGPDRRHLVVSGLMSTFKKIWVDAWSARMEYILSNTLLALLEYPGSTLLGVNRMLSDKAYREAVVNNIKDPSVKSFWVDEFAKYNERYMQEAGDAIKNKIGQFTANPLIRNIIGQPKSSFDVRTFMDEKKILIVNLSKGLIGETNANLLGSMLITRIYLSAMSRADLPAQELAKAPKFYFYVDEFQSFANETFASILSEARKYKLTLTIAHQYIEQMEEEVRNAVFGNVGTIVSFRVGPFDAEVLETIFSPEFLATDIVNLGYTQIYLTLMIDGIGSRPFSATTLPPIQPGPTSYKDILIANSRSQFGKPRSDIEQHIKTWHEPVKKPEMKTSADYKPTSGTISAPAQKTYQPPVRTFVKPQVSETPKVEIVEKEVPKPPVLETPQPKTEPVQARPVSPAPVQARPYSHSGVQERPAQKKVYEPQARHQAKPERRDHKPHTPTHKPQTVSDLKGTLRSVLSDMRPNKPYEKERPMHNKAPHTKAPDTDGKSDLRSALASVLNNPPQARVEPVVTPSAPVATEVKARPVHVVHKEVEPEVINPPVEAKDDASNEVDRKTLQKLERILRSKGNEKPPLS